MGNQSVDLPGILRVRARLGEAVVDPGRWRDLLEDMCRVAGAEGASLRPAGIETPLPYAPYTASLERLTQIYFKEGWNLRDTRVQKFLVHRKPRTAAFHEYDIFTSDEMNHLFRKDAFFNDFLGIGKLKWGTWIQFRSSNDPWLLSFQRTMAQGQFERADLEHLSLLSRTLAEVANLSIAVGHSVLTGVLDGLELMRSPALAVDVDGRVLRINSAANDMFDGDFLVRNQRLYMRDENASQTLERMLAAAAAASYLHLQSGNRAGNIVARREGKRPILIKLMPVPVAARSPFMGAEFVLALRDLDAVRRSSLDVLEEAFSLTPAEAKVASMIAEGCSPEGIADELNISRETVRNQLKAIFGKTETHRQNELAALISRIQG